MPQVMFFFFVGIGLGAFFLILFQVWFKNFKTKLKNKKEKT